MASYKSSTDEGKCVFCEIVNKNIQTPGIFWEDKEFMAFLSTWPSVEGFTVVIPKKHYGSDCLKMPDDVLQRFILASKKVSNILLKHFKDVGRIGLIMEGTGVDHAHIKLIPMHGTGHMKKGIWKQYLSNRSDYFEKYPGYIISTDGPKADPEKLKSLANKLKDTTSTLYVYIDGGSRNNPGRSAIGVVIFDEDNNKLLEYKEYIGESTNNKAEYNAMIKGLELAKDYCKNKIVCFSDSELLVKQLNGEYKVKNEQLRELFNILKDKEKGFDEVVYNHVKRSNKFIQLADRLVNDALDGKE